MFATGIIIFREALEITILIGVILAATKGIAYRKFLVLLGIAAGVAGAGLLAFFASSITDGLDGLGQEVMNGTIMACAAVMIGWTVVWMKVHGRELAMRMKQVGIEVGEGKRPLYSISIIVALAILREGAEIVLFLVSIVTAKQVPLWEMGVGALAGLFAGCLLGGLFYFGLLKVSRKYFFSVISLTLTFLVAGMASQSVGFYSAAGLVPELVSPLWDSSWLIADGSPVGTVLHVLIGYTARPSGTQALAYLAALVTIWVCLMSVNQKMERLYLAGGVVLSMIVILAVCVKLFFVSLAVLTGWK